MHSTVGNRSAGFTMVELVAVILLLGILAAVALPRFIEVSTEARVAALEGIAGAMRTTISQTKVQARLAGLRTVSSNPGAGQSAFIIETELGRAELDFRNLCPESSAELGDALDMIDYLVLNLTSDMSIDIDNRFTRVGYELSSNTTSGCYVLYDSFGLPDCTVDVITADC